MLPRHFLAAPLVPLFTTSVNGYTNPGPCSGDCFTRDPALVRRSSDGAYFRFATGGGIGIWKAGNITGPWSYEGDVLPNGSSIDLDGSTNLWAPDVIQAEGTYILYYSASDLGSQNSSIGYAISDTLDNGTWVDGGSTGIHSTSASPYNAIDPAAISINSTYYLNFGSYWGDIYQVKLNSNATHVDGAPSKIAYNASGEHSIEGSFLYPRADYYYLFFSSGKAGDYDVSKPSVGNEYKIFVCRSASVAGLYVDRNGTSCLESGGTLVLASHGEVYGPGGQGILSDPDLGDVLYYHYVNTSVGITDADDRFGWSLISWTSDGWPTV